MARISTTARAARGDSPNLEYSERAGFLTGKAAAIADWEHRKEEAQYKKLFERLRSNKRRARPEVKEKIAAYGRVYRMRPDVKARDRARKRTPKYYAKQAVRQRRWLDKPHVRARMKAYFAAYDAKRRARANELRRARMADPEYAAREKAKYSARPEVKTRRREQRRARTASKTRKR